MIPVAIMSKVLTCEHYISKRIKKGYVVGCNGCAGNGNESRLGAFVAARVKVVTIYDSVKVGAAREIVGVAGGASGLIDGVSAACPLQESIPQVWGSVSPIA